jgi:IMP dehydrogenase/GMP reductase
MVMIGNLFASTEESPGMSYCGAKNLKELLKKR